jgi:uncharacterized DUF497 family protein
MALKFEWNADKAASNIRKHNVTFDEASTGLLQGEAKPVCVASGQRPACRGFGR